MRVCPLVGQIAENITCQFENKLAMGGQMDECDQDIAENVDSGDNKHEGVLRVSEDVENAWNFINLQVDPQDIVDDQGQYQESIEWEYVGQKVGFLSPLLPEQTPHHAQHHHKNVN